MALRAGVAVADLEFIQFHPTALHFEAMPRPLLSEALRGHGALLRDTNGERFVDEMQPRDVVSRAETQRMIDLGADHVFLDATGLENFDQRFPNIASALREVGLDPGSDWLPVAPAAHYTCGGIVTDLRGASSLPGLWAAGEAACSGVHGANRLASNSLLEGMVFGPRAVEAIEIGVSGPEISGAMRSVFLDDDRAEPAITGGAASGDGIGGRVLTLPDAQAGRPDHRSDAAARQALQRTMTLNAGVVRSAASLGRASGDVQEVHDGLSGSGAATCEVRNLAVVARALGVAATAREESRGAHSRTDFPRVDPEQRRRLVLFGADRSESVGSTNH
jgi:L-aspartate oxidase